MTSASIDWSDPTRQRACGSWLSDIAGPHRLQVGSVRLASADASFRRYFRVDGLDAATSFIIMDAPPAQENCAPFVHVAELMRGAGVQAPRVLAWDVTTPGSVIRCTVTGNVASALMGVV